MYLRNLDGTFKSKKVLKFISYMLVLAGFLGGVAKIVDWGGKHQLQKPIVFEYNLYSQPIIIEREQQTVLSPVIFADSKPKEEFTPTEQKVIDRWGYKDGILAIAIFDCGESGLRDEAFSITSDLGVAQINWPINGKTIKQKLNYDWWDMGNTDKNLDAAYLLWDRGDGVEGNEKGNFNAWIGYTTGGYLNCFR